MGEQNVFVVQQESRDMRQVAVSYIRHDRYVQTVDDEPLTHEGERGGRPIYF
jgi:hypothetical protein